MLYRRARTLIAYWDGTDLVVDNYATRTKARLSPDESRLLQGLDSWHGKTEIRQGCRQWATRRVDRAIENLAALGVIETSARSPSRVQEGLAEWRGWQPAAAYFHFDTKDGHFADEATTDAILEAREAVEPVPDPLKRTRGRQTKLPDFRRPGAFPRLLLARRTWRRFGTRKITRNDLSTLLGLTWAAQKWLHIGGTRLPLKTSPSGGACHSLEVYVAVRSVSGLRAGLYHYSPDAHALVRLRRPWNARWLSKCLAGQSWCAKAGAVMFMTSVFPRVQWKYRPSRAYRTVLLEAGHFCQTFCLTATWLGLAPFCTAAMADSYLERSLGVDGVTESVIYVAGVGSRPRTGWAPWPDGSPAPRTTDPESFKRFPRQQRGQR